MLSESASGLRHLRWAREILASLEAHAEGEGLLGHAEREALREEAARLREQVERLSGAVKPYRDFLERTRVRLRGNQRAARFACDEAQRRADEAAREQAAARLTAHDNALAQMEAGQRRSLKIALRAAITEIRAELEAMNARLEARLSSRLVESLYPPLTRARTIVADAPDDDDDASA
jgi:flagellar biosynthesis/type III secretory pathway protein FliH